MKKQSYIFYLILFLLNWNLLYSKESNLNADLEKNEHISIKSLIPRFHPSISVDENDKIDSLIVQKIIKRKLDGINDNLIVILQCIKDGNDRASDGIAIFSKDNDSWKLIQTDSLCDSIFDVKFMEPNIITFKRYDC